VDIDPHRACLGFEMVPFLEDIRHNIRQVQKFLVDLCKFIVQFFAEHQVYRPVIFFNTFHPFEQALVRIGKNYAAHATVSIGRQFVVTNTPPPSPHT
jgi:hypothetical protein